jgi:spore coat protein U-like protein
MKRLLALPTFAVAAALVLAIPDAARAQATNTSTLTVTATVVASCEVSSAPLAFGLYHGAVIENVDTTIDVICNVATDHWVGLDRGETGARSMRDVATTTIPLSYELYRDAARTVVWDDTAAQGAGYTYVNQAASTSTVFGRLFADQIVAQGDYDDNVLVTVNF